MADVDSGAIVSRKDYDKNPSGQYEYWSTEIKSSQYRLRDFLKQGGKIVERYTGGKPNPKDGLTQNANFRLNLFHSNVITLKSLLYGNLPTVRVSRRHSDYSDDVGRVAALIMERLLNNDLQDHGKDYESVLKAVLEDRLLPGLGVARVRYDVEVGPQSEVINENAPTEYFHWRDVLWGWGRTFKDLPWVAFRSYLSKDEVEKRFGEEVAKGVQLKKQEVAGSKEEPSMEGQDGPWQKAEIWEIWDKASRSVVWISPGYDKVLQSVPDPLKLKGFFPVPPMMVANSTTSLYQPTSDFYIAQDLYNELDELQTRISVITEAVKVVGVYDAAAEGIQRMFKEGTDNELIPVDNWALFAEKGGIAGQIDWVPITEVVEALSRLRELRDETIGLLQQVTGMSDIMRGDLGGQYEGVGQSQMKARFGSVRVQSLQDEFSGFAADLLQIKAEIIGRHYEPETIGRLANVESLPEADIDKIMPAIQLIKNPDQARLQVKIQSESMALIDYAQLQSERTEFMGALSNFMASATPLMEADPSTKPFLLHLLQWGLSGFKGANEIEGVIDAAIEASEEAAQQQQDKPDPDQQQAERDTQLEQLKHQNTMAQIQAKSQADSQLHQVDTQSEMVKMQAELSANLQEIAAKMQADIQTEVAQSRINAEQQIAGTLAEVQKEVAKTALKIKEMEKQSALRPEPKAGRQESGGAD